MIDGGRTVRRILCIDGGGIRGLIPALILQELEERVTRERGGRAKPLHECFDMIAGTSTGGLIAAGLVSPAATGGGAACNASALVMLYRHDGIHIFPRDPLQRLGRWSGFPYRAKALDALLAKYIGVEASTGGALTNVVIPTYDLLSRQAVIVAGGPDYSSAEPSFALVGAARATSAAPTYFRPKRLGDDRRRQFLAVDGGVYANDPAITALVEAVKLGWPLDRIEVLSISTGEKDEPYPTARRWTLLGWVNPFRHVPLISILMQAGSSTTSYQMQKLLGGRYTRVPFELPKEGAMDDASPRHLGELTQVAKSWIAQGGAVLDEWARRLAGVATSTPAAGASAPIDALSH